MRTPSKPDHVNPVQWSQAVGYARQTCAKMFAKGCAPADAIAAYGFKVDHADWAKAIELIAETMCEPVSDERLAA